MYNIINIYYLFCFGERERERGGWQFPGEPSSVCVSSSSVKKWPMSSKGTRSTPMGPQRDQQTDRKVSNERDTQSKKNNSMSTVTKSNIRRKEKKRKKRIERDRWTNR